MVYRVLADAVMLAHFAFLVYVIVGGFLAWRWRWTIIAHVVAAGWGFLVIAAALQCPLTAWENHFRRLAGGRQLPQSGFIDHYIEGVLYPERYSEALRLVVGTIVLISWIGLGVIWFVRGYRQGTPRVSGHNP